MAFTVTGQGATEVNYVTSTDVGNAFTPNEDDIVVLAAYVNAATSFTGVSGWSATFVEIEVLDGVNVDLHVWAARMGASPGSDTLNVNMGFSTNISAVVVQIAGANTTKTVGLGASDLFVQSQKVAQYDPANPLAIPTLSAYASSTNLSLQVGGVGANVSLIPQSGWTEAQEANLGTNGFNISVNYLASEDTTHEVEGSPSSVFDYRFVGGIGFEVAEEAAVGAFTPKGVFGKPLSMPLRGPL